MPGEEVFLRGMYELVNGATKHVIAATVFGRDWTAQSRAFKWFILHMFNTFSHLITNNLDWWNRNGLIEHSKRAIYAKMISASPILGMIDDVLNFCCFMDCNCLESSRVGGGPSEGGANAMRWSDELQRAFYNGWKSIHGLKHQTVDGATGHTWDIYGPTSLRK